MANRIGPAIKAAWTAFVRRLPGLTRDVAGVAGVGLVAYGAWLIYAPAGFIVAGVLMLTGVVVASRVNARPTGR